MSVTSAGRGRLRMAALALAGAFVVAAASSALAGASPFGVGLPDSAVANGGLFPGLFRTVALWQARFYHELTATLKAMKDNGSAGLWLVAVSFLYGIFHALGPGHGKAVISAYVLANRQSAKNGALLAMVSALAQAVTAVTLITVAAVVLDATSIAITRATALFEIGSFGLIVALGLWLVARKILGPLAEGYRERYAPVVVGLPTGSSRGPVAELALTSPGDAPCHHGGFRGLETAGVVACGCGHAHVAAPETLDGPLDWRRAASTIAAVGIRPCTGALIVLVFALSQGIYAAGILSAFAMAIGTGLTVASLTLATVFARGLTLRLARTGGDRLAAVQTGIEALAALAILAFGLVMLGASLYQL